MQRDLFAAALFLKHKRELVWAYMISEQLGRRLAITILHLQSHKITKQGVLALHCCVGTYIPRPTSAILQRGNFL